MTYPFGEVAVLHRATGSSRDSDGNTLPAFTDVTIPGGAFDPGGSTELVQGQDTVSTQPTWFAPQGVTVTVTDQVTIRGVRFEVDGTPGDYMNPFTGWRPGVVVKLKAVAG